MFFFSGQQPGVGQIQLAGKKPKKFSLKSK